MDEKVLIKIADAARIVNISRTQAYRLVPDWDRAGIVVKVGPRSIRINRKGLLAWAGETTAVGKAA